MIVLMAGLPGTGKSTLAQELAARTNGRVLGKDEIRSALFRESEIEFSSRQDDLVVNLMLELAEHFLSTDSRKMIYLDGRPFSRRYQIQNVVSEAARMNQPWRIVECVCSEDLAKRRLAADQASGLHVATNRNARLYDEVRARFENISHTKVVIDTSQPAELCIEAALAALI